MARVKRDARDLSTFLGEGAYREARQREIEAKVRSDDAGRRHWTRVAEELQGMAAEASGARAAERLWSTEPEAAYDPKRRTVELELVVIASAIRDLVKRQAGPTTLHNAEAAVYRFVALSPSTQAEHAGDALRRTLVNLAQVPARTTDDLLAGRYPALVDGAEKLLDRLRGVVLAELDDRAP